MTEFIFPPRPVGKTHPRRLPRYQKAPWIAQRKFNGTRNLIHIVDGDVICWMRKGEPHKQWEMSDDVKRQILDLNLTEDEYWLDSELLHHKTTDQHYKNRIVLFDVLHAGKYLFRSLTLLERYELLANLCGNPTERESKHGLALVASENLWLAENIQPVDFVDEFKRHLDKDQIEGLVLKDSTSTIDNFGNKYYEVAWQVRCRKPTKNYTH